MTKSIFRTRSPMSLLAATLLLGGLFVGACATRQAVSSPQAMPTVKTPPVVVLPGVPSGAKEPQAALGQNGRAYIAFGASDALYCSASGDGGRTYNTPVKIPSTGKLSLGMRRGPRVAAAGKTVVVSAVYGQQGKGRDGDLLAWRSGNNGRWQGPVTVNDVPGAAREGLHAMAASPDGRTLACAWLDLRRGGTQIYSSVSRDSGATWSRNTRVYTSPDGTVCECCHPSLAFGPKGSLLVMWRNALGGGRDMYLSRSSDNGKTFGPAQKLGAGTWPLNACPMDGGALTAAPNGTVTTVWRRGQEMFACEPGGKEKLLGRGEQGWVAATTQGVYAVWLSGRPGRLMASLPGQAPRLLAERANDPVIVSHPLGKGPALVTWLEDSPEGSIHSMVLEASPPK